MVPDHYLFLPRDATQSVVIIVIHTDCYITTNDGDDDVDNDYVIKSYCFFLAVQILYNITYFAVVVFLDLLINS